MKVPTSHTSLQDFNLKTKKYHIDIISVLSVEGKASKDMNL